MEECFPVPVQKSFGKIVFLQKRKIPNTQECGSDKDRFDRGQAAFRIEIQAADARIGRDETIGDTRLAWMRRGQSPQQRIETAPDAVDSREALDRFFLGRE